MDGSMTVRALIFDFDGVIIDTESAALQCWQEMYEAHGHELPLDIWLRSVGRRGAFDPYTHLESLAGPPFDMEALRTRRREREAELACALTMRPGVLDYLNWARSIPLKLAIASSSSRGWVSGHIERHGIHDRFETLVCAEDVTVHKPDPAPYLKALRILNVRASDAVAIEDSAHGVAAAKAAGIFTIACPGPVTRNLSFTHADMVVESLAAFPPSQLLTQLQRQRSA